MTLTPKQKRFLDFINEYTEENGVAPSQREIAQGLGYRTVGTVQEYKVRLEKLGFLRSNNQGRGLEVVDPEFPKVEGSYLPLVGKVAAGYPIEAIETEEKIEVPPYLIGRGEHFVLKVEGNSMIEDAILDGDLVVIKKQKNAENHQTVVALIDGEATIKRFKKTKNKIELHPANPEFNVIEVRNDQDFKIEGILAGVIRKT